jgi:hypothetical protein
MERVVITTVAGAGTLYLLYLLMKGTSPKVTQRAVSTVPKPVTDPKIEPRPSGSASSVVKLIASSDINPQLDSRPTELGGDLASTGAETLTQTTTSLDTDPVLVQSGTGKPILEWDEAWCEALTAEQCKELSHAYVDDVKAADIKF